MRSGNIRTVIRRFEDIRMEERVRDVDNVRVEYVHEGRVK